jgi:hypothetical protein
MSDLAPKASSIDMGRPVTRAFIVRRRLILGKLTLAQSGFDSVGYDHAHLA